MGYVVATCLIISATIHGNSATLEEDVPAGDHEGPTAAGESIRAATWDIPPSG